MVSEICIEPLPQQTHTSRVLLLLPIYICEACGIISLYTYIYAYLYFIWWTSKARKAFAEFVWYWFWVCTTPDFPQLHVFLFILCKICLLSLYSYILPVILWILSISIISPFWFLPNDPSTQFFVDFLPPPDRARLHID